MKLKNSFVFFIFWWAIVFPGLFFSNDELADIKNNTVSFRVWIYDTLGDN